MSVTLDEFIADIKKNAKSTLNREIIRLFLWINAKLEKWAFIVKLLISGSETENNEPLTKEYFLEKLISLRSLMKEGFGFQVLDPHKQLEHFKKFPEDKDFYLRSFTFNGEYHDKKTRM